MQPEQAEDRAQPNERLGCLTAGTAIAATAIFIAAVVNAVMHLAQPRAATLLTIWAVVGTLGCALYVIVRGRPRSPWLVAAGFVTGAIVPVVLRALAVLTDNGLSRWTDYWVDPTDNVLAGIAGAILAPGFVRLLMRPSTTGRFGVALLTAVSLAGLWLAPLAVRARSCHNPLRNSAGTVSPVTEFEVRVDVAEWALLQREIVRYAKDGGWQVWSDVRADPSYPWFEVSVCREPGTVMIFLLNPQKANTVEVDVYQPQGGSGWRKAVEAMQARIAHRWPGSIGEVDDATTALPPLPPPAGPKGR